MHILWINNGVLLFWKRWKGHKNPGDRPLSWLAVCWYSKGMPFPDDQVISPLELDCNTDVCNHNLHKHRLLRQRCPIIPCRSRRKQKIVITAQVAFVVTISIPVPNAGRWCIWLLFISGLGPCNYGITQWYATPWTRLWPTATVWRYMLMLIYQCVDHSLALLID